MVDEAFDDGLVHDPSVPEQPEDRPRTIHAYKVTLTCRDCGATYTTGDKRPNQTIREVLNTAGKPLVGIMLWAPARCEQCHNLRPVPP